MSKGKVGIIIQARMGSKRLPGKVLKTLAGKPIIQWIVERLLTCKKADALIVATTVSEKDLSLRLFLDGLGIEVYCGSEEDVLDRYYMCALQHGLDVVVRATGDNPFVDPLECDRLIDYYFEHNLDYASGISETNGYPKGVGVEALSVRSLEMSWHKGLLPHHREHVNEFIMENPSLFLQKTMPAPYDKCYPLVSMTVDDEADFKKANFIYEYYLSKKMDVPLSIADIMTDMNRNGVQL